MELSLGPDTKLESYAQRAWTQLDARNTVAGIRTWPNALQGGNQPIVVQPNDAAFVEACRYVYHPITSLPEDIMDAISSHLPPKALTALRVTCHHFRGMLDHNRLWQTQLQQSYPIWADAGVTPRPGSTWKKLVVAVRKVERPGAPDISLDLYKRWECPVAVYRKLWNSGTQRIELDFCLSRHAHAANLRYQVYGDGAYYASWIAEALTASLDMVYFCWLEEQELARGAKYLAQALNVLANAIQKHAAAQEAGAPVKMWYAGTRLKEQAAAAGGFLVELLQMRSLPFSPLSLQAPAAFREACSGPTGPRHLVGPDDTFRWCGGQYCQTDLKEALAVLLSPDLRSHQLLAQQWEDPYQRAPWGLLRPHGQLLLDKLAEVSACQDHWEQHGSRLLNMAAEKLRQLSAERQDGAQRHHISCTPVAPFDLCRLHQQLGGAAIMARSATPQDRAEVSRMHGGMYSQDMQHEKAALYYQQEYMLNGTGPYSCSQHAMHRFLPSR